jgi:23S rRNA (guanosine2251-2'-O)-methyltransferase
MKNHPKEFKKEFKMVIGRNPVTELLESDISISSLLVSSKIPDKILNLAKEKNIPVKKISFKKMDFLAQNNNHQGVCAQVCSRRYFDVEEILETAGTKNEPLFILIFDKIFDPHNFGAIARTAECFGVHGIIIRKRESVGITPTSERVACGALEFIKIARVANLSRTIDYLKSKGIWICGTDLQGKSIFNDKNIEIFKLPIALVLGSEGEGITKLVKQKCDFIFSVPMFGKLNSLNVSVAAGVFMYKISEFRHS